MGIISVENKELKEKAKIIRRDLIRYSKDGYTCHFGGALSVTEILTYIYFEVLKGKDLKNKDRDKVILSKGHACVSLYTIFAMLGYIDKEELYDYKKFGGRLQAHPDMKRLEYLDFSSGSLGQGLSVGVGMAIANKMKKNDYNVYVIVGDGEIEEGQNWEAAMTASKYKLDNLICFIDCNKLQADATVEETMSMDPISEKWQSFGWHVVEIDGNDFTEIDKAYKKCLNIKDRPKMIIANTIKGKGISFMENKVEYHSAKIDQKQKEQALEELRGEI